LSGNPMKNEPQIHESNIRPREIGHLKSQFTSL